MDMSEPLTEILMIIQTDPISVGLNSFSPAIRIICIPESNSSMIRFISSVFLYTYDEEKFLKLLLR